MEKIRVSAVAEARLRGVDAMKCFGLQRFTLQRFMREKARLSKISTFSFCFAPFLEAEVVDQVCELSKGSCLTLIKASQ